jgi:MYXO-CTERM domain-containing protein
VVAVTPTLVVGSFFVGVFAAGIDDGQALVGGDTNSPLDRTFLFGGSAIDFDDLPGSADVFSFNPDTFDDALIRAAGVTVDEPAGLGLLALTALVLLSRRARPRCGLG